MKIPSLLVLMLGLLVLAPNERGRAHQGGSEELATRIYLHYSDTTMIYSELGLLALNPPNRTRHLTMQIRVEYKGKNRIKPELVQLFLGAYPRWSPSDKHKTHLLIFTDRRTFDVGEPEKSGYSFSLDLEMMNFTLPREQFLSVARATKVRLQLDGVDVDLTDAQLKRLKAFAKEIK